MPAPAVAAAITELNEVLKYRNQEVVTRFCSDHRCSHQLAEELFVDLKKWLWLCACHSAEGLPGSDLSMTFEMAAIDHMWHTFLLFTYDYMEFCHTYFGCFVHHQPMPQSVKDAMTPEKRMAQMKVNYEYIYDHLGPDVLKRWCEELPIFSEVPRPPVQTAP